MQRRRVSIACAVTVCLIAPLVATSAALAEAEPNPIATSDPDPIVEESDTGSYIVVMLDDPLLATFEPDDLDLPAAAAEATVLESEHEDVLTDSGISADEKVQSYTNALNGFSATLSHTQALKVASNANVAIVLPDELRQLTTDSSAEFLGLTGPGRAYASGLSGEGVVVGVIDSGIWPEHPSFADDGTYAAPEAPLDESERSSCEFGNTEHNANDAPFTCNNKLIGARQMLDTYRELIGAEPDEFDSARDDDGHGTHTAGTAAGNADVEATVNGKDLGLISGIAPRAQVIAYKGLGNGGGFTSDLTAAIDQAVADGVDVINYSVGGGANLTSADALAYLFANDAGVWVATSAGNSGPDAETIGGPADVPWVTTVGASTQTRFFQGKLTLRSNAGDREIVYGASVTDELRTVSEIVDAEFAGGDLCLPDTLDPAIVEGKVVLCRRGAIGRAAKGLSVSDAGGVGMILYNNTNADNLFTDSHWVPAIHVDYTRGIQVKEYLATKTRPTAAITATARQTNLSYAPSMAYFSSRGANSTSADVIKPDITAPGVQILAGGSPFPDPGSAGGELFQAISGTSMSSPHVAGFFALLKQAHPDWSPAAAKSAIMTTASTDVRTSGRGGLADPFDMGSGHLNPGRVDQRGTSFDPGLVYDAGFNDFLGFLCDAGPEAFGNPAATCASLESIGVPTDASDLNYPSIAVAELAGVQTVTRTVTSVSDRTLSYRPIVEAPRGYSVTLDPPRLMLAPGESATYTATIANTGRGPVGEWRFGSLTWKADRHEVRSPIAVRAAALDTPPAIVAEGTDGTASFDVQFGYTGAYTAASHGPVAPTIYTDTVLSDPDQTYPSADDAGGVVKIPIALTGAGIARWSLFIPGDDDIDLFLEDAEGTIIAASTNGATDESIELLLPPDGDYTMVVHGWSIPSEPLEFNLSEWVVSATPGGPMTVDSAPTEAVTGATGTVDVSWSGLDPDTVYLGAVSHSDASGFVAVTRFEISS